MRHVEKKKSKNRNYRESAYIAVHGSSFGVPARALSVIETLYSTSCCIIILYPLL